MIRQLTTHVLPITRDLAEDWATMPAWKGERPLNPDRVNLLASKISDGLFHSPTWAVATYAGRAYRMNGQHSSQALLMAETIPAGLEATILEFQVDTERELADLFGQFDNPASTRKMREVIRAHAAVDDRLASCPAGTLHTILAGIDQTLDDFRLPGCHEHRATLMHSHGAFIEFARQYHGRRHLLYQAVMAAMYLTWKRHAEHAQEFWDLVASEAHTEAQNPTRVLARFLTGEVVGRTARGLRWDRRAIMVKCLHAWNAYWKKQTTALKYTPEAPIPTLV